MMRQLRYVLATGFGSGLSPWVPGTMGTLMAIPFYLLLTPLPWMMYLMVVLLALVGGIGLCDAVSKDLGVHDDGRIVWDEMVGYWLTMFLAPVGWVWIVAGFLLFRVFDDLKPWPISFVAEHVAGGLGIMLDDVLAAMAAWGVLQIMVLIVFFVPKG